MGKEQLRLLKFAMRYPAWHTLGNDPKARRSLLALEGAGLMEVRRYPRKARPQFRIALPELVWAALAAAETPQ